MEARGMVQEGIRAGVRWEGLVGTEEGGEGGRGEGVEGRERAGR